MEAHNWRRDQESRQFDLEISIHNSATNLVETSITGNVTKICLRAPRVEKSACTTRRSTNFTQNSSWNNTAYLGLRRHAIYQTIRRRDQESRLNLKTTNQDVVPSKFLLIIISYFILYILFCSFTSITSHHTAEPRVKLCSIRRMVHENCKNKIRI